MFADHRQNSLLARLTLAALVFIVLLACREPGPREADTANSLDVPGKSASDPAVAAVEQVLAEGVEKQRQCRLREAERQYRESLEISPDSPLANAQLGLLLAGVGRHSESVAPLLAALRAGVVRPELLFALAGDVILERSELLRRCQTQRPVDPLAAFGMARIALRHGHATEAAALLDRAAAALSDDSTSALRLQAQALEGLVALQLSEGDVAAWNRRLPADAEQYVEVWLARGLWARSHGQLAAATRCFGEAARRDPSNLLAHAQLTQLLGSERPALAARFADRAERLRQLESLFDRLASHPNNGPLIQQVALLLGELGRVDEARGWCAILLASGPDAESDPRLTPVRQLWRRLEGADGPRVARTLSTHVPAYELDWSRYPLPQWSQNDLPGNSRYASDFPPPAFEDRAARAGIQFAYECGVDAETLSGRPMHAVTGGGSAVLDFDLDGWPDIYMTQGGQGPRNAEAVSNAEPPHLDALYRNRGNGRFEEVAAMSGIVEERFSQGATVGDWNNDGFSDLYVANIGANRLFLNNGDGTFRDVTQEAGLPAEAWTTSVAMVDLNGDGHPDIYDVNYVQGKDAYQLLCESQGRQRTCSPLVFQPRADMLYVNDGRGGVSDDSRRAGLSQAAGNGLGVVAADFFERGRIDLFVANDQDANFFLARSSSAAVDVPVFADEALLRGLAFDQQGQAQACMGVAAGDCNADGRLDLFVTNFFRESNTLYTQQEGVFHDASRDWQLYSGSLDFLGFGTQFLDGELDGMPDLAIANGHIDNFEHEGTPYRMRPQYLRNEGDRFSALPAKAVGQYFDRPLLGRGMSRLDWNRDGLEDLVVSHLDSPVALVTNTTEQHGHFVAIQLVGVSSGRDAIGSFVTVSSGSRSWRKQLVAGDGYMASNQRQLIFGLGRHADPVSIDVRWPDGGRQQFRQVPVDRQWKLVQGRPLAFDVSVPRSSGKRRTENRKN